MSGEDLVKYFNRPPVYYPRNLEFTSAHALRARHLSANEGLIFAGGSDLVDLDDLADLNDLNNGDYGNNITVIGGYLPNDRPDERLLKMFARSNRHSHNHIKGGVNEISDEISDDMASGYSDLSDDLSGDLSDDLSDDLSGDLSDDISGDLSEDLSGDLSDDIIGGHISDNFLLEGNILASIEGGSNDQSARDILLEDSILGGCIFGGDEIIDLMTFAD